MKINEPFSKLETVDERNEYTQRMTAAANIPRFNWTIDEESGDITVMSEVTQTFFD